MRHLSRLYSEGKTWFEKYWTRTYAVPIFMPGAVLRWIEAKSDVNNPSEGQAFRLVKVKTILELEVVRHDKGTGSREGSRAGLGDHS